MVHEERTRKFDLAVFNISSLLVEEMSGRSYLNFLCELDASGMDSIRNKARRTGRIVPTYTAFVIKAVALALREHPRLNAMFQERPCSTRRVPLKDIVATVAVERVVNGVDMVFAPMLSSPDRKTLGCLTKHLRLLSHAEPRDILEFRRFLFITKLASRLPTLVRCLLRIPGLSPALWGKFRGGAYVVTSPGKYGGFDQVLPPWPWPLTVSFGVVKTRPFVLNGHILPRPTMRLTITADRRLAHGAQLARFAEYLKVLLERPDEWERNQNQSDDSFENSENLKDMLKDEAVVKSGTGSIMDGIA